MGTCCDAFDKHWILFFIHVTFTAIVPRAYPRRPKCALGWLRNWHTSFLLYFAFLLTPNAVSIFPDQLNVSCCLTCLFDYGSKFFIYIVKFCKLLLQSCGSDNVLLWLDIDMVIILWIFFIVVLLMWHHSTSEWTFVIDHNVQEWHCMLMVQLLRLWSIKLN